MYSYQACLFQNLNDFILLKFALDYHVANYLKFLYKFDKDRSVHRFDFLLELIEELFLIQDRERNCAKMTAK